MPTIKLFKPFMPSEVDEPLLETLHSGMITQGKKVEEFEKKLGLEIDNPKVLSLNSGTSALTLALKLANVGPGDEVISTPMTCAATNLPVLQFGAKIVWADVHPLTGLIDQDSIMDRITNKTKAIISVDWGGTPVDYATIGRMADRKGITFISDAAHSLGAEYNGFPIGGIEAMAHMTAFSFQAIKTISTVDGGALSFSRVGDYERGKLLRWFGIDRENDTKFRGALDIPEGGYKFHMNDVNATIGIVALDFLKESVARQQHLATFYHTQLDPDYVIVDPQNYDFRSSRWLQFILLPNDSMRTRFIDWMNKNDVEVSQVHWRNDKLSCFKDFQRSDLTGLDQYSDRMIAVPVHHQLSEVDIKTVIEVMNRFPG